MIHVLRVLLLLLLLLFVLGCVCVPLLCLVCVYPHVVLLGLVSFVCCVHAVLRTQSYSI